MKEIKLYVPDEFTDAQVEWIKKGVYNQVKAELENTLKPPQKDVDAIALKVAEIHDAMGIIEPPPISI